jgi:hypothetical protein
MKLRNQYKRNHLRRKLAITVKIKKEVPVKFQKEARRNEKKRKRAKLNTPA